MKRFVQSDRQYSKMRYRVDSMAAFRGPAQRGASLIEVMVVMVVLLIGIFLAIRVFPTGFGILRANGNRSLATRLAEQQMSRLRSDSGNLPQGVLFAYPAQVNGIWQLQYVTNTDPDAMNQYDALDTDGNPDTPEPYNPYFSDVNKFRYIKGEAVKVPLPVNSGVYGSGSVYVPRFGPLLMDPTVGDPDNRPANLSERTAYNTFLGVYGAPLRGVNVESPGVGELAPRGYFRNQQTYIIDYGEDENEPVLIAFAPRSAGMNRSSTTRIFRVTITHDSGGVLTTSTIPVTVDDDPSQNNGAGKWIALGAGITDAVPGSETVSREFDRLAVNDAWDTADPYQYKLRSPNITTELSSDPRFPTYANIGVINFNPAGANYVEQGAVNQQPFTAYLDYAVLDWHILREDREVPSDLDLSNNNVSLRLALPIKRSGDSELDGTFYNGLYGVEGSNTDLQVFNLNDPSGTALTRGEWNAGSPTPANADYYVDSDEKGGSYRSGTIYINRNQVPAGSKLRILYKAPGDWAVALQKAYSRYEPARDPNNAGQFSPLPLRGVYNAYGRAGSGATAQLRFPLADLGKAFLVTVEYTLPDGTVKRLPPIQMTTETELGSEPGPGNDYDDRYAVVQIANFLPSGAAAEFASAGANWRVSNVQGVSVKSRVIWHDADSTTNRWRVQDMDSYLTPDIN